MLLVPGIGRMTGLRWRSHASESWLTVALYLAAKSAMGWFVSPLVAVFFAMLVVALPPMGYQGRKAMPCCSQNLTVASAARLVRL